MTPPSPVLSACDSLDGIEDLDAYLAHQGHISHFPTPPLAPQKGPIVHALEVEVDDHLGDDGDDDAHFDHIALVLTEEASLDNAPTPDDIEHVVRVLLSVDLPLVVVALAFNILSALHSREAYIGHYTHHPPDLLVVTALSLAVTCTYDAPHSANFWSRHVCHGRWTTARLERCLMKVLLSLDFRLHEYSLPDRLDQALDALTPPMDGPPQLTSDLQPLAPVKEPLSLAIEGAQVVWSHGQITPDETPCDAAFPAGGLTPHKFLPLL